ncbi:MAG: anti-anti-sigma factor [Stygiobacter sp. RIFOXYC12_FULL_38_8]|nr:MAG: anti-sigma-factor antagonist [Stygiobacter sp.]KAF0215868.1 MAG: anti-sigma-factor [Ignavibacteria bacterium]OGU63770.1 MAG: anti-anti-sigma factor [Stygiobacter sp. GWC2_38_9]OGV08121.1 MAG: anti-anti-sigma factor [Stygiobacter sp. RIFOXYB2_FULL_37_11]OGV11880.1 MAG: anti-anti-sigma factor [Stygiobacter sp. RIFOXYA2_FULL_38_8]OGV15637.1 MAG: anti-anti-sigma factor [Stygiobacter sp. RIFOXYC2_FULL_38_25]OGV23971.1 MAG: anti-anti-sigma factor [Stygiobacter sp. RIFOXYC12_FULL_38_8]OGV80
MAEFNVNLRGVGAVSVIDVKGYLDAHTAPELENVFNRLLDQKQYQVVVNFDDLKYISSAGLGVFMAYVETMRENEGDIKFSNMKENVYNIFDLLGFPILYEFFKEENEAIKKFCDSSKF